MPRPVKKRVVSAEPDTKVFAPKGREAAGIVLLSLDEFEALRLSDFEGIGQEQAAAMMAISRHTYGRILARARSVVAQALVLGQELQIAGGNYVFGGDGRPCRGICGGGRRGRGRGGQ